MLFVVALSLQLAMASTAHASLTTFDDPQLTPPPTTYTGPGGGAYWNGSDESGGFTSGSAYFLNTNISDWNYWEGWSYSNTIDTTTAGYTNQYSAYTGGAYSGDNYGVYYEPMMSALAPTITFLSTSPVTVTDAYFTNTTYAALSMLNGDSFAKKFGGETGDDPDWFKLMIRGIDGDGNYTSNSVEFYLADYRFEDNTLDYIVDEWTGVDLSALGPVIGLEFDLSSSDVGAWGMNTPAYVAMDNLNTVPIPGAVWLLGSALAGLAALNRRNGQSKRKRM
jgi:hypothetical protein